MFNPTLHLRMALIALIVSGAFLAGQALAQQNIKGQVLGGGAPIAKSTVTLWEASTDAPKKLAETKTNDEGRFDLRGKMSGSGTILYLVASGGVPKASKAGGDNPGIVLLSVLGKDPPEKVVVNELTTVASAYTAARFINQTSISGNLLGLKIAAGNAPNLVDPVTGTWGKVLIDPLNSYMTATLAMLDTLGSLVTASFTVEGREYRVDYLPAESNTGMFGGNSNWRGPIWMPVNGLIIRGLLLMYPFYGPDFKVECPTGSGNYLTLFEVAQEIGSRLAKIFLRDANGNRPVYGGSKKFQEDPYWKDYILYYEYFHGENGAGLGASHQTGWTGVIAELMRAFAQTSAEQILARGQRGYFEAVTQGLGGPF